MLLRRWLLLLIFLVSIQTLAQDTVPGEYLIKLDAEYSIDDLDELGIPYAEKELISKKQNIVLIRNIVVNSSEDYLVRLNEHPAIIKSEPNMIIRIAKSPRDSRYDELWGMNNSGKGSAIAGMDINVEKAWDITTGNKKVVVAVIDTGIDYRHEDLMENIWHNNKEFYGIPFVDDDKNGIVDDFFGADFANDDGDPLDDHGHGTHCAGTIGAKGDNGVGVAGVNWKVSLMALKFLDKNGAGSTAGAIRSIEYAVEKGADILSNSWGSYSFSSILKDTVKQSADAGVLFVAAAGNEGKSTKIKPMYPASLGVENIISVAAINKQGRLAYFSNYGHKVQIAAPGQNILSTAIDNKYKILSGTSMAAPHVSGVAALVLAKFPDLTHLELKDRILNMARNNKNMQDKVITNGMVDAFSALTK